MHDGIQAFDKVVSTIEFRQSALDNIKEFLYLSFKRTFDIIISLIGLLFILPIAFIIKVLYVLQGDFTPILFKQKRIGINGTEFKLYKFRTMVPNATEVLNELLKDEKYKKEWDLNQKLENDPRITKVGKLLRKTSLDEIPQFINIFKGDMSLVGPRPLVENELDSHGGIHFLYESVKPGITGWWGCNGRSNIDYNERLSLEYFYVRNKSIKLDIKCIFKTIISIINKEGAK